MLPRDGRRPLLPAVRFGRRSTRRGGRVRENESPERAFGGRRRQRRVPEGRPTAAGSSGGPWQDNWVRRGVSVSLGRGRPRRCAEEAISSARGSSAPGRSRRLQAASAGAREVPAGPLQEAGCALQSVGVRGRLRVLVRVRGTLSGSPRSVPRQPPAGSQIRAGKSWTLVRERISQEGRRAGAPESLGRGGTSRSSERPRSRRSSPSERPLPWTPDGGCDPRLFLVLPPLRGEGGDA